MTKRQKTADEIIKEREEALAKKGVAGSEIDSLYGPIRRELRSLKSRKQQVDEEMAKLKAKLGKR
ncbi:MAG: hypothetical protein AB1714_25365 [Acidobacteriota bacterium]